LLASPFTIQKNGVNEAHGMFGSSKMYANVANVCEKDAFGGNDLVQIIFLNMIWCKMV